MFDSATPTNWTPLPSAPFAFSTRQNPPDDIDRALDSLAEAIDRASGKGCERVAEYLDRPPGLGKVAGVISQLTSSRLAAFLERRNVRRPVVPSALVPGVVAAGAADRLARAQLFRRLMMDARLYALKRACDAVALTRAGGRT
jgi:hypothetical protein